MKVRTAVIPAAGLGTRLLPATKSQPKEMLPRRHLQVSRILSSSRGAINVRLRITLTARLN